MRETYKYSSSEEDSEENDKIMKSLTCVMLTSLSSLQPNNSRSSSNSLCTEKVSCENDGSHCGLKLSASSRAFFANHLYNRVARSIKDVTAAKISYVDSNPDAAGGIKLFKDSEIVLTGNNQSAEKPRKRAKKRCYSKSDEEELNKRASVAAVSSDWILSGAATKGWVSKNRILNLKRNARGELEIDQD